MRSTQYTIICVALRLGTTFASFGYMLGPCFSSGDESGSLASDIPFKAQRSLAELLRTSGESETKARIDSIGDVTQRS